MLVAEGNFKIEHDFRHNTEKRKCPGSMMPACIGPTPTLVRLAALDAAKAVIGIAFFCLARRELCART